MALCPTTWVAPTADGGLEVFVVGIDHGGSESLWHRRQTAAGVGCSDCSRTGLHQTRTGWPSTLQGRVQLVTDQIRCAPAARRSAMLG